MRPRTVFALVISLTFTAVARPAVAEPLTLERAVQLALARNEQPRIAAARVDRARAQVREAWASFLPSASVTGTYTRRAREVVGNFGGQQTVIQSKNALNGAATARLGLVDASAIPDLRSARTGLEASRVEAGEVRRQLAFQVADVYLQILAAQTVHEAAVRSAELARATVADASARLSAGLGNKNDVTRAELTVATADLSVTQAANTIRSLRLTLQYLIAAPVNGELAAPQLPEPRVATDDADRSAARRPDVHALELRAHAADQADDAPLLGLVPSVDLIGTYSATNESGFSGHNTNWNVALTLTWNLYDGGFRYAQAHALEADTRAARLQAQALTRQVKQEVAQAALDMQTAEQALHQAEVRARVATQNADEVRERFAHGLATSLDVTDGIVQEFEAQAALAQQRLARQQAGLSYVRATGGWPVAGTR